ncbi:MAG: hypothetical protein JKX76_03500 [Colwellia sp.]|nr:hypothetical protein [Colwellia sp.]
MPTEYLDIIDTAVKIGFGALISGITTYMITHKSQRVELDKEARDKKIKTLEFSIENLEPFFFEYEVFLAILDGHLRSKRITGKVTDDEWFDFGYQKFDDELVSTRKKKNSSISRLNMIGMYPLTEKILEINEIENQFRQKVIFEKYIPNAEELSEHTKPYLKAKKSFYAAVNESFNSLYR